MYLFEDFKSKVKDGDKLITQVNSLPGTREVTVQGEDILCQGYLFHWNFFFEVNTPIEILGVS